MVWYIRRKEEKKFQQLVIFKLKKTILKSLQETARKVSSYARVFGNSLSSAGLSDSDISKSEEVD